MMERSFRAFMVLALFTAVGSGSALAATPRITQNIDERELTTLSGNTRPEASSGRDLGAVPAGRMLEHLQLELKRSAQEEQAVEDYIGALHDPSSPLFHHWMSSVEFGARFGVAEPDLEIIEAWLTAHGFTVNAVYPSRMVIDFSGTEGQLAVTFHTELHRFQVNGVAHLANVRDPSIPAALAPVIAGIIKLNDFSALRKHRPAPKFTGDCEPAVKCYLMAPADLATIYDFNPLFQAARPITGKGQRIAVVEDTDLYTDKDWSDFREIFGLSHYTAGSLTTIHPPPPSGGAPCQDPGVNADGDDVEAALDVEWSSAAAPEAAILLAACNNTETIDGVQQAIHHLVDGPATPPAIISVSYGICETENGAASNADFTHMYQQADAEGISVFVATGDSGPEDCAPNYTSPATLGVGVNAWASTPHNVAVGGTDFSDTYAGTNSQYWSASHGAPWGTAKSYIPEMPWNDTCAGVELTFFNGYTVAYGSAGFCNSAAGADYLGTGGGEGGPSGCATGSPTIAGVVSGTCKGWPKPSYQRGLYGVPDDGVRDVPDVAMFAADGVWGHQYLLCFSDPNNYGTPCVGNPASWGQGGGGTSYSTPIVAGIQALVNQKMGEAQGNPNFVYYRLAAREYGPWGNPNCNSSNGTDQGPECVFHDVTTGNDAQDCTGRHDCYRPSGHYGVMSTSDGSDQVAFEAHAGYDYPTGIGTIDAAKLVNAWAAGLSCSDP
jgi:subtilase family serine protease